MYSFFVIFKFPLKYHSRQKSYRLFKAATKPHMTIIVKLFSFTKSHMTVVIWQSLVEIDNFIIYYKIIEDVCGGFQGYQPCPHILWCSRRRLKKRTTSSSLSRSFQITSTRGDYVRTRWGGIYCRVVLVLQNEIDSES